MIVKNQIVEFGTYPVATDGKKHPISWIVLDVLQDKALLLSERCIEVLPYNDKGIVCTWESCSLRNTLNSIFFNSLFNDSERSLIMESSISNPDNTLFFAKGGEPSAGGNDTNDHLFLLSSNEVEHYFPNNSDSVALLADYAKQKLSPLNHYAIPYWLRDRECEETLLYM